MTRRVKNGTRYSPITQRDAAELARFRTLLQRRADKPDEPLLHAYAEVYGEVVFQDPDHHEAMRGGHRER